MVHYDRSPHRPKPKEALALLGVTDVLFAAAFEENKALSASYPCGRRRDTRAQHRGVPSDRAVRMPAVLQPGPPGRP